MLLVSLSSPMAVNSRVDTVTHGDAHMYICIFTIHICGYIRMYLVFIE